MIDIQMNERMIYKIVSLLPMTFNFTPEQTKNLKEISIDVDDISVYKGNKVETTLDVELKGLKLFIKIFKVVIPVFSMKRTSGKVTLRLFLKFDKKNKCVVWTPIILKTRFKKLPRWLTFLVKSIFNVFYRHTAKLHMEMTDLPLEGISLNRYIIINNVITKKGHIHMLGHLDNHSECNQLLELKNEASKEPHAHKDVMVLLSKDFLEVLFFEILPKFFSTGVPALPDIEFKDVKIDLYDNNNARLVFIGHLLDNKENPFEASITGKLKYVREKQHIEVSNINIDKIDIENTAYNSMKKAIELFIRAYLLIPIKIPDIDPILIPVEELDMDLKLMFTNISYNINEGMAVASADIYT